MPTQQITKYEDLRKEVAQRYEQLHPDLKAALVSVDTAGAVYEIAKKFGLNIEKTGYLADVIGYTIIGLLPVADFMNNLKDTFEVDGAKAEEISREVNAKIFLAIREQLKKTHGEKWDERAFRQPTTDNRQPTTTPLVKPTTDNQQLTTETPTTPKSPWEIKPDGFQKIATEAKSVIPPASQQPTTDNQQPTTYTAKAAEAGLKQPTTDNQQPTTPQEPPKTREAPQPAPAPRGADVLKEIRPLQQPTTDNRQPTTPQAKQITNDLQPTIQKTMPPIGLPVMKEAEKLMQTPELPEPEAGIMNKELGIKETEKAAQPQPPQSTPASKPQTPQEISQSKPQAPQQVSVPTQKYNPDPYREPIE